MAAPTTSTPLAVPSLPAADDAWQEKQRKLAEARARLLAAKAAQLAAPPAELSHEQAALPASAPPPIALEASAEPAAQQASDEELVFGPLLPKREWFPPWKAKRVKVGPIGESTSLPPLADDDATTPLHVALTRALGEKAPDVRKFIKRLASRLGDDAARALYAETQAIEASGGMLTERGDRRRSPGGVFLQLARKQLGADAFTQAQVLALLAVGRMPQRWR